MEEAAQRAVRRVIETMYARLDEPITIDDMARTAMFSKFHFSRVFQQATGVSPGRFLTAIRLQEAKRLLVSTSVSVTEITHRVGYASVGTFSSRFTGSVGTSPTAFRDLGGFASRIYLDTRRNLVGARTVTLRGVVGAPPSFDPGLVFVGLFPDRMPQGRPVRCTVLPGCGPYVLEDVPQGTWHVLAHSVAADRQEAIRAPFDRDLGLSVGASALITIRPERPAPQVNLELRPQRVFDPPVLLALLDVRSVALRASAG